MKSAYLFDFDGTVTKHELLPIIGKKLDLERELKTLTDLTVKGLIPFEESFRLRFAILRALPVNLVRDAIANVELEPRIVSFIQKNKDNSFIVTGNLLPWISHLVRPLDCRVYGNDADHVNGHLTKLKTLRYKSEAVFDLRCQYDRIIAIGEGANDVSMFEAADVGIAYGGVHMPFTGLYDVADYVVFEPETLCRVLTSLS